MKCLSCLISCIYLGTVSFSLSIPREEPHCVAGDQQIPVGENITIGSLIFSCQNNAIRATGCVFIDDSGNSVEAKVGETVAVGDLQRHCQGLISPGGNSSGDGSSGPTSGSNCKHDGQEHEVNETWTARSFRYKCQPSGQVQIIACLIDKNNELSIGQSVVKFGLLHRCFRQGDRVSYNSAICGANGVQCNESSNSQQQIETGSGSAPAEAGSEDDNCVKDGQYHKSNETWVANNFKYVCNGDGSVTTMACVTDTGKEIELGGMKILNGYQHVCTPKQDGAVYYAQLCGANVKCTPEAGPNQS